MNDAHGGSRKQTIGVRARALMVPALLGAILAVGTLGTQAACASSKTCSASESTACDNTFTACVNTAASTMDKTACNKCVDDDCTCYTNCGSTCDKAKLSSSCAF